MKKTNLIKTIIISAVVLGEIAVWSFPYDQNPYLGVTTGGAGNPASVVLNENSGNQKPTPDILENPKEDGKAVDDSQEKPAEGTTQTVAKKTEDAGVLILVNKNNYLDESYKPNDLEPIEYFAGDRSAEARFMKSEAADHFNEMMLAARESGYEVVMTTAYRSYGFQTILYENYVEKYGKAEADKFSAKPGYSEHQTGLAVDVTAPSVDYALTDAFDQTAEWKWLTENAADFGFVLRYPKGQDDITGYMYEPWHFRYVGIDAAKTITEREITLEEYIDK
ncbi:MAG: M15 family metallopeptidase [Peptostreptococcaceae bacterium]|nr:M15 family metallopeptidase [Peptostreptococcaceae bacterium]